MQKPWWKSKPFLVTITAILALVIAVHLYLEVWVKDYVNKKMADLDGYSGSIEDIDIHLWRGAYKIDGLNIFKTNGGIKEPFFSSKTTDLSIEWRALFKGAVVAEVTLDQPNLNFAIEQTGEEADWGEFIDSLAPFEINKLTVKNGKLSYLDHSVKPEINLFIENVNGKVSNLNNIDHKKNPLPSNLTATGKSIGNGKLSVDGNMNVLTTLPSFDIDVKLVDADLTGFNDFARHYGAITFEKGTIGIFCELASTKGELKGYVKPIITDINIVNIKDGIKNPFKLVWESVVSVFLEVLENHPKDQFAMRIPIEGKLDKPRQKMWSGFLSIFSNAFRRAFQKNVDGTINFKDVLEEAEVKEAKK